MACGDCHRGGPAADICGPGHAVLRGDRRGDPRRSGGGGRSPMPVSSPARHSPATGTDEFCGTAGRTGNHHSDCSDACGGTVTSLPTPDGGEGSRAGRRARPEGKPARPARGTRLGEPPLCRTGGCPGHVRLRAGVGSPMPTPAGWSGRALVDHGGIRAVFRDPKQGLALGVVGGQVPAQLRRGPLGGVLAVVTAGRGKPLRRVLVGLGPVRLRGDRDQRQRGRLVVRVRLTPRRVPCEATSWQGAIFESCGIPVWR